MDARRAGADAPADSVARPATHSMPLPDAPALGPYRLLRILGRGSMGVVHLAIDRRTHAPVALKTLDLGPGVGPAEFDEARTRFLAEVETAKRLSHADIVAVYDAGEHDGRLWMAMEPVPGCEATRYTRAPRLLPEALVLQLAQRLARALAHAHALGVVHRDIKPGNVLLDLPGGGVKLADFGVAGVVDMSRTRTGVVLGTPVYMAPEQLAGAAPDARSDLYSLGVLLFQLLTGRLPHEHASLGELLRRVAREPAPDVRSLRAELSPALAALVAKALHKQPAARHAGGAQLADELADALAALPAPLRAALPGSAATARSEG
jgi:serine/threonine-protein kinase